MELKTTFVGKNPFTNVKAGAIDPCVIVIDSTATMPKKRRTLGKYDAIFSKLKFDENMIVPLEIAPQVSQALRSYLRKTNRKGKVHTFSYQPTPSKARIFLTKE